MQLGKIHVERNIIALQQLLRENGCTGGCLCECCEDVYCTLFPRYHDVLMDLMSVVEHYGASPFDIYEDPISFDLLYEGSVFSFTVTTDETEDGLLVIVTWERR